MKDKESIEAKELEWEVENIEREKYGGYYETMKKII